jgi:hypothetical protein
VADRKPFRIDAIDAGRDDQVARFDVRLVRHQVHREWWILVDPGDHPSRPRPFGPRPRGRVVIDEELHPRGVRRWRPDDAADDASGCDHRHIRQDAVSRAAADGQGQHAGVRVARDHLGGDRRQRRRRLQLEQLLQPRRPRRERPLLLQPDFELRHLLTEQFVFRARAAEPDVGAPKVANPVQHAGRPSLHAGKCPERDRLEHREARLGLDLRRDQDQLRHHDDKQQDAGASTDV